VIRWAEGGQKIVRKWAESGQKVVRRWAESSQKVVIDKGGLIISPKEINICSKRMDEPIISPPVEMPAKCSNNSLGGDQGEGKS